MKVKGSKAWFWWWSVFFDILTLGRRRVVCGLVCGNDDEIVANGPISRSNYVDII